MARAVRRRAKAFLALLALVRPDFFVNHVHVVAQGIGMRVGSIAIRALVVTFIQMRMQMGL